MYGGLPSWLSVLQPRIIPAQSAIHDNPKYSIETIDTFKSQHSNMEQKFLRIVT